MTAQAAGFYRRRAGAFVVTALSDGYLELPSFEMLTGIGAEEAARRLAARFRPRGLRARVNGFLVQGGGRSVLIDTGAGTAMGPHAGRLLGNLEAAGVAPEGIDLLLLMHAHRDHIGGMVTADGAAVFPEAAVQMAAAEHAYWHDDAVLAAAPEAWRETFAAIRGTLALYEDRIRMLGEVVMPGITAVPLPGHTPGHTGFRIGAGDDAVLVWGDVMHMPDLQAADPEIGFSFDADPAGAVATRKRILEQAAGERLAITGMHMDFPGFAHLVRAGGGYEVVPEGWTEL